MGDDHTLSLVAFLFLSGCAAPPEPDATAASAIQGGFADLADESVVGVAVVDGDDNIRRTCSGSLIAPNLVLTAQHCVANTAESVICRTSVFGPPVAAARLRVTANASMWAGSTEWMTVAEVLQPPGAPVVCGRDVALLVLDAPLACAGPIAPRLDAPVVAGETYTAVGYGASHGGADDAGLRRRRNRLHVLCVGDACETGQVESGEWRGDHGICNGDSGGPALDAAGLVIGVTSRGPSNCDEPIYGGLAAHATWIREGARRAARDGGYAEPAWSSADMEAGPPCTNVRAGGGCALSRSGEGAGAGATWIACLAVLFAALRRRWCGAARP